VSNISTDELEALGLYDPQAPHAAEKLELLEYLIELGASQEDLVEHRDGLPGLASVVAMRGGQMVTVAEAVERSGLSEEKIRRLNRAAGFADPGPDGRVGEGFVYLAAGLSAAEDLFGEDAVLQLVRVMGAAMARVADAGVSAFLVNVEPAVRGEDPVDLGLARANAEAGGLVPVLLQGLEVLLRQHLVAARRTILEDAGESGYETQRLAVGFVDLVGSTALAQQLSTRELGGVLTEFENTATDTVTDGGGRVVKLIGDEVLFTAPGEQAGCSIALELTSLFSDHPRVPAVRAGVGAGDVMLRGGDVFGPVVNLAARAVSVAGPSEVVAPPEVAAAAGFDVEPLGPQALKGFDAGVELCRVLPERR